MRPCVLACRLSRAQRESSSRWESATFVPPRSVLTLARSCAPSVPGSSQDPVGLGSQKPDGASSQHIDSLVWAEGQRMGGGRGDRTDRRKRIKTRTQGAWEHLPTSTVLSSITTRREISDTLRGLPAEHSGIPGLQAHCPHKLVYVTIPGHDSHSPAWPRDLAS